MAAQDVWKSGWSGGRRAESALERLNLVGLQAPDLGSLAGHAALEVIDIRHATKLRDLSALASTPSLRELTIRGSAVRDLAPPRLRKLRWLMLEDTHVTDVRLLLGLGDALNAVGLPGTVPAEQVAALRAACPKAQIDHDKLLAPEELARRVANGHMTPG